MIRVLILRHAMLRHTMLLILSCFIWHAHRCGHLSVIIAIGKKIRPVAE